MRSIAHHGHWPYWDSGPIVGLTGETWETIDRALSRGLRGLAPGKTLASLLNQQRGIFGGRQPSSTPSSPGSAIASRSNPGVG